mmetsp:Transcript_86843/g.167114  ORF Transcript_86843/g.167114 Transcript_86843/m.167114 type:complete len:118 (+) Transcript_86843:58-411(+)
MALRAALRFNVLPQTSQASLRRLTQGSMLVAPTMSRAISIMGATSFPPATIRSLGGTNKPTLLHACQTATGAMRTYGTRSVWNVAKGRNWILVWVVAATVVAGVTQEILGPYVFFHE